MISFSAMAPSIGVQRTYFVPGDKVPVYPDFRFVMTADMGQKCR